MVASPLTIVAGIALAVGVVALARRSVAAAFAVLLLALVAAGSSIGDVKELFLDLRWAALGGLGLALAWPLPRIAELARFHLAVLAVLPITAASALWSIDPRLTLLRAISFAILLWTLIAVVYRRNDARANPASLVTAIAALSAFLLVASLLLWVVDPSTAVFVGDLRGVFENPNGLGLFLGLTFPFVAAALEAHGRGARWASVVVLPYVGATALAESRSGLVALLVGVTAYGLSRRAYRRLTLELCVIACGFVLAAWTLPSLQDPPATSSGATTSRASSIIGASASGQSRLSSLLGARDEAWSASLDLIAERRLRGYGFGTGDSVFEERPDKARFVNFQGANPNNGYLQALLELGALGLGIIGLLSIPLATTVAGVRRRRLAVGRAALLASLSGGLVAGVFESLFTAAGAPWSAIVWLSAIGLAAPAYAEPEPIERPEGGRSTWVPRAAALVTVAVAGIGVYLVAGKAESSAVSTTPRPSTQGERRAAERAAQRLLEIECRGRCRISKLEKVSKDRWRIVITGAATACYTIDADRFFWRHGATLEVVETVPCLRLPLISPTTLTVAAPFDLLEGMSSTALTSFRIALVRALADRLEVARTRWVTVAPYVPAAAAGVSDIVLHPVTQAATSRPDVDTSFKYLPLDIGVLVRRGRASASDSLTEVAEMRVAVGEQAARRFVRAALPNTSFKVFRSPSAAAGAVRNGGADVMLAPVATTLRLARSWPSEVVVVGRLTGIEGFVFLLKSQNGLLDPVNEAIRTLSENGTLARLRERWLPDVVRTPVLP